MVLLIPGGRTPDAASWIVRDGVALTWQQVADDQGADRIEIGGGTWAVQHGFPADVYGFIDEADLPPIPGGE